MENALREVTVLITTYGVDVIGAVVLLVVGLFVAGWTQRIVERGLAKTEKVDETLRHFFASLAKYFVIAFTGIAVLSQFGVQTASLIAIFGAAGLAIGLALQGTLSNVAAGVMLLLFRPFKVGDYIDAGGITGTVKSINLFMTELATPDNVQVLAPNSQMWGKAVKNYSHHETRRIDLVIGIAYEDNIDEAMAAAHAVVSTDARILADPEPMIAVTGLGDSAVDLLVRVWCAASDYWALKCDLNKGLKERFDADGITIPYPQRTLHLIQSEVENLATGKAA
ncbi:MAG: mechanosensitive ion channel family protein [Alphaproteobacteria bacterium]